MKHRNPITFDEKPTLNWNAATQDVELIFLISFSQDCSAPLPWSMIQAKQLNEAKFIRNNIKNVTVLTAKYKS